MEGVRLAVYGNLSRRDRSVAAGAGWQRRLGERIMTRLARLEDLPLIQRK
jgi:hypothetical protein